MGAKCFLENVQKRGDEKEWKTSGKKKNINTFSSRDFWRHITQADYSVRSSKS